jgi:uncharacterized protein (TIGR03067 family)
MRRIVLTLALLPLAFAPAPFQRPKRQPKADLPAMVGLWRRQGGGSTVRITATTWTNSPEQRRAPDFDLTIDPRASPAAFDMSLYRTGRPYLRGIYKVEGDTLTICYSTAPQARPTTFDAQGKGWGTLVFTRVR